MTSTETKVRIRCSGQEHTLDFDLSTLLGDTLEELEEHLGGEAVYVWLSRMSGAFRTSVRVRDMRTRDLIALVFLARAQAEPGTSWREVATSIAPYTFETLPPDPAPGPAAAPPAPAPSSPLLPSLPTPAPPAVNPLGIPQPENPTP